MARWGAVCIICSASLSVTSAGAPGKPHRAAAHTQEKRWRECDVYFNRSDHVSVVLDAVKVVFFQTHFQGDSANVHPQLIRQPSPSSSPSADHII